MDNIKTSKKELCLIMLIMIVYMIIQLFYMNLSSDGKFSGVWAGLMVGSIISELMKEPREDIWRKIFIRCSIPMIMIFNCMLFRFSIYIPNYIILLSILGVYLIYLYKKNLDKHIRILCGIMLFILILFFYTDYYIKSNNIIKDINFRRYISKEYDIKGKIEPHDLENIEKLMIHGSADINSIEGVEYFTNLKELNISDAYRINDFSPLAKNESLKELGLWYMDLNDLKSIPEINNIEGLNISHPRYGKLYNLKNFQNLKKLHIRGIEYTKDLNCIKPVENINELYLGSSQIVTFDGIEKFESLEELYLNRIYPLDVSKVFELKNLKKVSIDDCNIQKKYAFIQKLKDKGIEVEMK